MDYLESEVSSSHIEAVLGLIDHVARVVEARPGGINHYTNLLEDLNSDRSIQICGRRPMR
jgi:hypothetical protein